MVKNERQYKITKAQVAKLARALSEVEKAGEFEGIHPRLIEAQKTALRSQIKDLEVEIEDYESLLAGEFDPRELHSVASLPLTLIKARIAKGISQRELAERLGLKQQQIQRYEATDYASASLTRIGEIVDSLGYAEATDEMPKDQNMSVSDILDRVARVGMRKDVAQRRLIPFWMTGSEIAEKESTGSGLVRATASVVQRVFGWRMDEIIDVEPLNPEPALETMRFKVFKGRLLEGMSAYVVYVHYLSLLVSQISLKLSMDPIPTDPMELHKAITVAYGSLTLESLVNYCWDLGVPVVGIDDPGGFAGACFREQGRNVIVVKQRTSSQSRWMSDILHELWHAAQEPGRPYRTVIEDDEMSPERLSDEEETTASQFAGAVLLGGRMQELADISLSEAQNDLRFLKRAVKKVSASQNVPVDALANYIAFRLSLSGENWWGAATNLQPKGEKPHAVVKDIFLKRAEFAGLAETDRNLLLEAISGWEDHSDFTDK